MIDLEGFESGDPNGIRTRVTAVKGLIVCCWPTLNDSGLRHINLSLVCFCLSKQAPISALAQGFAQVFFPVFQPV